MKLRRFSKKGLQLTLGGFLVALLVPTLMLVFQAYQQLERDTFFQYRTAAEELTRRIDEQLAVAVLKEDEREFSDYGFLVVAGEDFIQRSPLSEYPVDSPIPGAKSYFQVDADGNLTTPLIPAEHTRGNAFGVSSVEYTQRLALQNEILQLFSQPRLEEVREPEEQDSDKLALADDFADNKYGVSSFSEAKFEYRAKERVNSQIVLDLLEEPSQNKTRNSLGRVEDLKLDAPYGLSDAERGADAAKRSQRVTRAVEAQAESSAEKPAASVRELAEQIPESSAGLKQLRLRRLEQNVVPARQPAALQAATTVSLESFTSEVEPLRFATLDALHFVLYRTAWRDQARYVQGLVINRPEFLRTTIGAVFADAPIATLTDLIVAYEGDLLQTFNAQRSDYFTSAQDVTGTLLHQTRLSSPFNELELIFSAGSLPISAGSAFVMWTAATLVAVLLGGFWLMYQMGLQQMTLNRQQQDFVSAVSHELKTPLTSIRMYGEILRAGWATEEKKRSYYDYIFFESERLSRLINNVLQLARLTRNATEVKLTPVSVGELADVVRSKIASQIEQAKFEFIEDHDDESASLMADPDSFTQIMINLVDNAIKFSAASDTHRIEIKSRRAHGNSIEFSVRDHGPGVPKDQMRKIFELFYRTERELTRETVGTGIGLALVHELVNAMGGKIKAQNVYPGVEFRMQFPMYDGGHK